MKINGYDYVIRMNLTGYKLEGGEIVVDLGRQCQRYLLGGHIYIRKREGHRSEAIGV